ncbi:hypothetical protein IFM89_011826 [Coptis chinensis]|uniref:GATA-type domain-containing protein n=1 Tax=Coptis chinensis TaxID=261450 RepID=A0A835LLV3_9MAGN|nr:hypothetical protein IFM89_011826 [Coptis chinensis]
MDFCRNVSVSGGLPSEYQPEQVISPAYSKLNGTTTTYSSSLDDLFPIQNTEGDVSLEWLSAFVEDCLSSSGNCIAAAPVISHEQITNTPTTPPQPPKPSEKTLTSQVPSPFQEFSIPGKARTKRKRSPTNPTTKLSTTFSHLHTKNQPSFHHVISSDPPLLHQEYWLADSELINVPKKMKEDSSEEEEEEENTEEEKMIMSNENLGSLGSLESSQGQPRRCTHCLSQKTPQWRAGPLGPKTLCNACGVRFKSGRLLPEYRPAKSPTFVSYMHSNSHKKVLEMRMSTS